MITHERLVEEVAARAHLDGTAEAGRVVRVTLAALSHRLEMPQRQRLRQAVPGPERDAALATVPPTDGGRVEYAQEIGRHLGTPPERASFLARTVLSYLAQEDAGLGQELRDSLPAEFAELFSVPELYPERRHAATDAPAPLTPEELEAELRRRPQWGGDLHQLVRTAALPGDRIPPLLNQVGKDSRELNHRCEHESDDSGITFRLRTRSVDAVTPLDLALADRIDAAIAAVGSGGRPG